MSEQQEVEIEVEDQPESVEVKHPPLSPYEQPRPHPHRYVVGAEPQEVPHFVDPRPRPSIAVDPTATTPGLEAEEQEADEEEEEKQESEAPEDDVVADVTGD